VPHGATTNRAQAYPGPRWADPSALRILERYARTRSRQITDGWRLGSGRCADCRHLSARIIAAGHALVQNLRHGHYELTTSIAARPRLGVIILLGLVMFTWLHQGSRQQGACQHLRLRCSRSSAWDSPSPPLPPSGRSGLVFRV